MVLFACLLVTIILYYLQSDGLIYVTIVAVVAELFNLFMTQTMTATTKNKAAKKYGKIINDYKNKATQQVKTINQLKKIRDDSVHRLYKANQTIKKYEEELGITDSEVVDIPDKKMAQDKAAESKGDASGVSENGALNQPELEKKKEEFIDLPSGSNRKQLPI